MAWASVSPDATFTSRMQADVIRPADFLYLNWPSGVIRATTHHTSVTDQDANVWAGVGRHGFIKPSSADISGAAMRWTVGLTGLPVDSSTNEEDAIGVDAELYLGVADAGLSDWKLDLVYKGFVQSAGKFEFRKENGQILMDVSLELGDQRNPNKGVIFFHSMQDGAGWPHLHTVEKPLIWPQGG